MERWATLFPNGNPDAHRDRSSQSSDPVRNPLSEVSGLDNEYTSLSTLPTGRKSQSISVLWNKWCGVAGDSDPGLSHLSKDFGNDVSGGNDPKYSAKIRAMEKNVTVGTIESEAAFGARAQAVAAKSGIEAAFAMIDSGPLTFATVKGNYRLGSVNPNGGFSNFTGKPMSNGGDDIATITLQQYRDGMG